jgi:hypothetical protein
VGEVFALMTTSACFLAFPCVRACVFMKAKHVLGALGSSVYECYQSRQDLQYIVRKFAPNAISRQVGMGMGMSTCLLTFCLVSLNCLPVCLSAYLLYILAVGLSVCLSVRLSVS